MALVAPPPHNSHGSHIGIAVARKGGMASSGMTFVPLLKLIHSQGDRYKGTVLSFFKLSKYFSACSKRNVLNVDL
jgi:hypothetical protein